VVIESAVDALLSAVETCDDSPEKEETTVETCAVFDEIADEVTSDWLDKVEAMPESDEFTVDTAAERLATDDELAVVEVDTPISDVDTLLSVLEIDETRETMEATDDD
jgi:hypothetical protein